MALTAVQSAMNHEGIHSLHPFFSKPLRNNAPNEDVPMNETSANDPNNDPDYELATTNAQSMKARKNRTRKNELIKDKNDGALAKHQASLEQFTRLSRALDADDVDVRSVTETTLEEGSSQDRRKRRKTESPDPKDASIGLSTGSDWQQLQAKANDPAVKETQGTFTEKIREETTLLLRSASPVLAAVTTEPINFETSLDITPKKQIKVTKSGKLVSSPPKPKAEELATPKKRRRGRPAKANISPMVTIIKYGTDSASRHTIGGRIEAILSGINSFSKRPAAPKKLPPKTMEPPKVTHPFFTGKPPKTTEVPIKPTTDQPPPTPRKSAITPGKLRAEVRRDRSPGLMPAFGLSLGTNRGPKQSGILEASWPTRETTHVRNQDSEIADYAESNVKTSLPLRTRKLKNRVVSLKDDEDLISRLAKDLAADIRVANKEDEFEFAPPADVRLPTRLLTTGTEIQRRVKKHLQARRPDQAGLFQSTVNLHPAVVALFADIGHTLTPFDEGRCEVQTWAQKYSPKCASHILQKGGDAAVLKDWLQSLTVLAVGGAQISSKLDTPDGKKPPKKKRKKVVDDFVVFDDEEDDDEEMIEISDTQVPFHTKSFRRPRWSRDKNVVLISGPHGCGKSAMVYAVAKELDFEVFEINSGTRRSGKDIQDKVGDMTAYHLVNHKRPETFAEEGTAPADEIDNEQISEALQKDIDSGRQGTMMNFFKSNATVKPKPKVKAEPQEPKQSPIAAVQAMLPQMNNSRKSQKQSLILFEEADILFEEDQQFWAQVTKLAAQSKRPIIITCNDERQVPMQDLPLAAILRLQPSPVDLATDYMLVLAGREGHILERQAVDDLYRSKNHDLRASITELDLWCQMSVGDRKGGLEWMYQRWPPGKDVDAEGRVLRVASEGTYQPGMGFLSHNVFETRSNICFDKEAELLTEVWAEWGINPSDWETHSLQTEPVLCDRTRNLESLAAFTETLSAVDMYCRVGLPSYKSDFDQPADPTSPPVTEKTLLSYTLAAPLLQADQQSDFLQFDTSVYTQMHLLARRAFPALSGLMSTNNLEPSTEIDYTKAILNLKGEKSKAERLSRQDIAVALDVLAVLPDQTLPERTSFMLTPSSFDRTFSIITLDLAPYVRSIVAHEQLLEAQRIRLSNLLSGGGTSKRARTTRASRVALEGGIRETKRRDRWFNDHLNFELVMATAGKEWTGMGWRNEDEEMRAGTGSATGTHDSAAGIQDIIMHDTEEE